MTDGDHDTPLSDDERAPLGSVHYAIHRVLGPATGVVVFLVMLVVFGLQLLHFGGSFEAGSIWCWSALPTHVYFCMQPYVWPCHEASEANKTTTINGVRKTKAS